MMRTRIVSPEVSSSNVQAIQIIITDPRYFIAKKITIDRKDNLIIEDLHANHELNPSKHLQLPSGYFKYLCKKMVANDLFGADSLYTQSASGDGRGINILVKYSRLNRDKNIRVIGIPPDFVTRALIPMIYSEDLLNYPDLWLKVDFAKNAGE